MPWCNTKSINVTLTSEAPVPPADTAKSSATPAPDVEERVKNVAGLVLAAFVGAINLLGLTSGELKDVIRNYPRQSALVAALLLFALTAALASVFTSANRKAKRFSILALMVSVVAVVLVTVFIDPQLVRSSTFSNPRLTGGTDLALKVAALSASGLAFIIVGAWFFRKKWLAGLAGKLTLNKRTALRATSSLIITGAAVTALAVFAALRLETASQSSATAAELSATLTGAKTAGQYTLSSKLMASKYANDEYLAFSVVPMASTAPVTCVDALARSPLTLATFTAEPDNNGNINVSYQFPVTQGSAAELLLCAQTVKITHSQTKTGFDKTTQIAGNTSVITFPALK